MARIEITTKIRAPQERCFDLARSIDLHCQALGSTGEEAVGGVTSGLIGEGQEVTWLARHFGVCQRLTSRITAFERPSYFRDSMVRGAFKRFDHEHHFSFADGITTLKDIFDFEAPFGVLGKIIDRILLRKYMAALLTARNDHLKKVAESNNEWMKYVEY